MARSAELPKAFEATDYLGTVIAATYRIVRHIASGGSGYVFEAEHARLGKRVAVKLLRPEHDLDRRVAQRFRREARAIALLQNEFVVGVTDCGELDDRTPYLIMDLLHGEDLRQLLNRAGPLSARRALRLLADACRGLVSVHEAGLVHRDLKPENLFVTRHCTGEDWCKILDFGVAKLTTHHSTVDGALVGTVTYMAPEQLTNSAQVSPATDVFAIGAILYECLSGDSPHAGETTQETMFNIVNRAPLPLAERRPELPARLVELVHRCLDKDPARRPLDGGRLLALLEAALTPDGEPSTSAPTLADDAEIAPRASTSRWRRAARGCTMGALAFGLGALAMRALPSKPSAAAPPRSAAMPVTPAAAGPPAAATGGAVSEPPRNAVEPSKAPLPAAKPASRRPAATITPRASSVASSVVAVPEAKRAAVGTFDATDPYRQ